MQCNKLLLRGQLYSIAVNPFRWYPLRKWNWTTLSFHMEKNIENTVTFAQRHRIQGYIRFQLWNLSISKYETNCHFHLCLPFIISWAINISIIVEVFNWAILNNKRNSVTACNTPIKGGQLNNIHAFTLDSNIKQRRLYHQTTGIFFLWMVK